MPQFSSEKFTNFIIENHVIGFFENPITLKSGRATNWYINWRTVTNDVFLLDKLTDFIVDFLKHNAPSCQTLFGVPEGATKTALLAQLKWAKSQHFEKGSHVLSMGRAKPKESHGDPKDQYFIGVPQGPTVVLEDTCTTGDSLINTIDYLLEHGVEVTAALTLSSRSEKRQDGLTPQEFVEKNYNNQIAFYSLSEAIEILPEIIAETLPDLKIVKSIQREFEEYGIQKLELDFGDEV